MSQRVVVGLESNAEANLVTAALEEAGAESTHGPTSELPDVLVVTIPDQHNIDEFIRAATSVPGVRYAEPDSWQFSV